MFTARAAPVTESGENRIPQPWDRTDMMSMLESYMKEVIGGKRRNTRRAVEFSACPDLKATTLAI